MSDAALFAVGSVLFIATTWATIAFLLARFQASYRDDVLTEEGVAVESDGLTERYVRSDPQPGYQPTPAETDSSSTES